MEFVCFKWKPPQHYRSEFGPDQPNTLWKMIRRNYTGPARLTCVTDDPVGISPEINVLPLWDTFCKLPSPHGGLNPACYRRLPAWGEAAREWFGPRFVMIDLDVCIVGNINPVVDVPEDFRMWGDTAKGTPYNGSLVLMNAGARKQVFEDFDPVESPKKGRALGYIGSDQAWIGACLGPNEKKWTARDGVYSFRNEIAPRGGVLPPDARIVIFHGSVDPWHPNARMRYRWIREHYR
jgi:hypothetical protein